MAAGRQLTTTITFFAGELSTCSSAVFMASRAAMFSPGLSSQLTHRPDMPHPWRRIHRVGSCFGTKTPRRPRPAQKSIDASVLPLLLGCLMVILGRQASTDSWLVRHSPARTLRPRIPKPSNLVPCLRWFSCHAPSFRFSTCKGLPRSTALYLHRHPSGMVACHSRWPLAFSSRKSWSPVSLRHFLLIRVA